MSDEDDYSEPSDALADVDDDFDSSDEGVDLRDDGQEDTEDYTLFDEASSAVGEAVSTSAAWVWGLAKASPALIVVILTPFLRVAPGTWRLYHKLHRWSGYQMQKSASADALANVHMPNGHEDIRPAKWVEAAEDEKDLTGWKIKGLGDKRYDSAVHDRATARFGKANIIHIDEDATEQGTWAEPAIDNAIQLDRERYLFRSAEVNITLSGGGSNGNGKAVADGGQLPTRVDIEKPGVMEDALIPINSPDDYSGQVVSWTQYQNLKEEQSDQETVREAKNRAWAAAKLDDIEGRDMLKIALIVAIWSFILLFHQDIGAAIAGLTNSGGGAVGGALG